MQKKYSDTIFAGASFAVDAACSSGLVALWAAYNDVKEGRVEAAVVNAGQLALSPVSTRVYLTCGFVSTDGKCNPFDIRGKSFSLCLNEITDYILI